MRRLKDVKQDIIRLHSRDCECSMRVACVWRACEAFHVKTSRKSQKCNPHVTEFVYFHSISRFIAKSHISRILGGLNEICGTKSHYRFVSQENNYMTTQRERANDSLRRG